MTDSQKQHRVSDVVTSGVGDFYPLATKTTLDDVIAMGDVLILDTVIIEDFRTEFGVHPFAVVAIETIATGSAAKSKKGGDFFTFPTSGQVLLSKLRELKTKGALPIIGCFVKEKQYYDVK